MKTLVLNPASAIDQREYSRGSIRVRVEFNVVGEHPQPRLCGGIGFLFWKGLTRLRGDTPLLASCGTARLAAFAIPAFHGTPELRSQTGAILIGGQNAAASSQDRRACVIRRGQMTHAGLAAMAVAARLGPA